MDEDDKIKRDIDSPLNADDHTTPIPDNMAPEDDIDDDFGRELDGDISTHPRDDTDVDSTERYQEQDPEDDPADEMLYKDEEDDMDE